MNKPINPQKEQELVKLNDKKKVMAEPTPAPENLPSPAHETGGKVAAAWSMHSPSNSKLKIAKELCTYGFISVILYSIKLL